MSFLKETIGNFHVHLWFRCIILTTDFQNKTNFQLFSNFFPNISDFFSKVPLRIGLSVTSFIGEIKPGMDRREGGNSGLDLMYRSYFSS